MMYGTPWNRYKLGPRKLRLQVVDVTTAFEREPELVARCDKNLLRTIAAPEAVAAGLWQTAQKTDRPHIAMMRMATTLALQLLEGLPQDGRWLSEVFGDLVLERLRVGGQDIDTWAELAALRLTPIHRWRLLGLQLAQTYGPLWSRSPYKPSSREPEDYGVAPPDSPIAVQWAGALGPAMSTSPVVILREWTPDEMIKQVEIMAQQAEISRRAQDAAASASG